MARYYITAVFLFVAAGIALFCVNLYSSSRQLGIADRNSSRLMLETGKYLSAKMGALTQPSADESEAPSPRAKALLKEVVQLTGLEKITVIDRFKRVTVSSSDLFSYGDDFSNYLIDPQEAESSFVRMKPGTTSLRKISGLYFRTCCYPVEYAGEFFLVVLDADKFYYTEVIRIRRQIIIAAVLQLGLLLALLLLLLNLMRRHARTLERIAQQEKLSFLGHTAMELAHEIKNPLGIIKASADVLQRKFDPEKSDKTLGFISSEIMRISRLIDDILNFARERPLNTVWINAGEMIRNLVEVARPEWPDIQFAVSTGPPGLQLNADPDRFQQILWNLVKNAAEAMDGRGEVHISLEPDGGNLIFHLGDSGPGIPEELLGKVFTPFISGKEKGTGLGLAVVAAICGKHSWKVRALPSPKGALMEIEIPENAWRQS